jgi:hypothetical protein
VTLDDLVEQTWISAVMHRLLFGKFMRWYSTIVLPLFVKMPIVAQFEINNSEYTAAGFPGAVCAVDCVHVRAELTDQMRIMHQDWEKFEFFEKCI